MVQCVKNDSEILKFREDKLLVNLLSGDSKDRLDNFIKYFVKPMMNGYIDMVFDIIKPSLVSAIESSNDFIKNTVRVIDTPYEYNMLKNEEIASIDDVLDTYSKVFMEYNAFKYSMTDTDEFVDVPKRNAYLEKFYSKVSEILFNRGPKVLRRYGFNFGYEKSKENTKSSYPLIDLTKFESTVLATMDMHFNNDKTSAIFTCRINTEIMTEVFKNTALRIDKVIELSNQIQRLQGEKRKLSLD